MILLIYNYSQEVRDLFYTDSIRKKLTINLSENPINLATYNIDTFDIYKSLSDDEIISESMEFSEALTEETKFTLHSFSCQQLSVNRVFEQKDFTGCACNCILSIYQSDGETIAANIMLLSGYVTSDEASEDRKTRKLTCLDSLGQILDREIFSFSGVSKDSQTINSLISQVGTATKISFYKGVYDDYGVITEENMSNFPELNYNVNFTNFENSYTIKDFISDIAEALGAFILFNKQNITNSNMGIIGREIVFVRPLLDLEMLYPQNKLYPHNSLYPLLRDPNTIYAKFTPVYELPWYKKIVISTKNVLAYEYFSVYIGNQILFKSQIFGVDTDLEYKISNNILLQYANKNDVSKIVDGAMVLTSSLNYFIVKLEMPYLAFLQPGDYLLIESEWGTYIMPIIKVEVKGINSLNATVTCELATQ